MWKPSTYHKMDPVTVSAKSAIPTGTVVTCLSDGAAIWSSKESSASVLERVAFGTDLTLVQLDSEYCVVKTSAGATGYIYSKYCSSSKTRYQAAPREATLSVPDNAARIWVYITPISETYTITSTDADGNQLNSAEVFYWQGEASTGVGMWLLNLEEPPTPSAPTLNLSEDGTHLTAIVQGIDIGNVATSPDNRPQVCFIIKKSTAEGVPSSDLRAQIDHGVVSVSTDGVATFQTNKIVSGQSYCAMARVGIYYNTALASNGNWNASSYELWWGDWSEPSEAVKTKPGAFSLTKASASSETSVTLSWDASSGAESYEIYYSSGTDELSGAQILMNPDAYSSSLYQTVSEIKSTVTTYTVAGLTSGAKYYFRIKATNNSGDTYSLQNSILSATIGVKPSPPSTWSYTYTAMLGDVVKLYFSHNSSDNSKCSKYKIHYSIYLTDGTASDEYDTEVTLPKASSDDDSTIIMANLDTSQWSSDVSVKWKVATAGVTGEYSDWSVERTLNIYQTPVITTTLVANAEIGEDGVTYDVKSFPIRIDGQIEAGIQYPIEVRMTVTSLESYTSVDFQGQPVTIPANTEIYSKSYYNDWRQWHIAMVTMTLLPMQISLKNNIRYRIDIAAAMSSGLTASQTYTIHTVWDSQDMIPEASIGYNTESYCTYIRPRCRDINGVYIDDVTMAVYRRDYDGEFVEIASGVSSELNSTVTDPHPSLNYVSYRIVAVSNETGEIAYADTQNFKIGVPAIVIQWDDDWKDFDVADGMATEQPWSGSLLVLPYNIDTTDSTTPDVSLVEYAGRSHPVSYYGTHLATSSTWNTDIPAQDLDTLFQIRRLQSYKGDVYVREPTGVGYWANITVNYNIKHCELTVPITFNIKRVEMPATRTSTTEDHEFIKTDSIGDLQNVLMTI